MSGLESEGVHSYSAAGLIQNGSFTEANVVLIIYSSLWLGALGWEVFLTIPFDYRLLIETNWKSILSTIHSLAYYLSRYGMVAFITLFVRQTTARSDNCDQVVVSTTAMLCVSVCATNLVFLLRTCAIWNMRWVAVLPLALSWACIFGFAVTIPAVARTRSIDGYCVWNTQGFFVGAALVAVAVFGVVCFILTVLKLNRQGWKSAAKGLLPQSKPNLDSEDVNTMLVQRTTAYFAIQFVLLIIVAVVYFAGPRQYRLMNVVAFNAITSSMAGKIFRRSWRLTRYVDNDSFIRPPSYFPGWAEQREEDYEDGGVGNRTPPRSSDARQKDTDEYYVEGDFGGSFTKLHYAQQQTPASLIAAAHTLSRRGSHRTEERQNSEADGVDLEAGRVASDPNLPASAKVQISPADQLRGQRSIRRGARRGARGRVRPSTEPNPGAKRSETLHGEMVEIRPTTASTRPSVANPVSIPAAQRSPDDIPGDDDKLLQTCREDLNQTPTRSRLWLDSRAARMEAAAMIPPGAVSSLIRPSSSSSALRPPTVSDVATISYAPSTVSSSHTASSRTGKKAILENASKAGAKLHGLQWRLADAEEDGRPHTSGSSRGDANTSTARASFLPSPAIVSPVAESSRLDRRHFDFDAIRESMRFVETSSPPEVARRKSMAAALSVPSSPLPRQTNGEEKLAKRKEKAPTEKMGDSGQTPPAVRPKTAPSRPSTEKVPQYRPPMPTAKGVEDSAPPKDELDVLDAFRRVIEDDAVDCRNEREDLSRPRTSRGDRRGSFSQHPEGCSTKGDSYGLGLDTTFDSPHSAEDRPGTSHGGSGIRPFGLQTSGSAQAGTPVSSPTPGVSAIEAQYQKLAALVSEEEEEKKDAGGRKRTNL